MTSRFENTASILNESGNLCPFEVLYNAGYYFKHIYNGMIYTKDTYYPMMEFKILKDESPDIYPDKTVVFKDVNYRCAWFVIMYDEEKDTNDLIGPIHLDQNKIKNDIRIIDDKRYPAIHGQKIVSVSNEDGTLIEEHTRIPDWILLILLRSIAIAILVDNIRS